jgi:metal-sulfur cluster biosynthetic enzyme
MQPKPYPYTGPEDLRQPIDDALHRVLDPEVGLSVADVGLIYGVDVGDDTVHVRLTMTSAACPLADVIIEDLTRELDSVLPPELALRVELVWDPPWTPERMSVVARLSMGW